MSLGTTIKKARIDKGWQQQDLVAQSGLGGKYVSQLERDLVDPHWSTILHLAQLLDLRLDEIPPPTQATRRLTSRRRGTHEEGRREGTDMRTTQ